MFFKSLDVAIGIVFLYLLLTLTASVVLELFSTWSNWRAKILHDAIKGMLEGSKLLTVDDIYDNPLIIALSRDGKELSRVDVDERHGWRPNSRTPPSYMPASVFSAAVLEGVLRDVKDAVNASPDGAIKSIRMLIQRHNPSSEDTVAHEDSLMSILNTTLITQGPSIQAVRLAIEKWFNDTMDRASGWYKRRSQSVLLMVGVLMAFAFNISTVSVARWLWKGDAVRQSVMTAASEYARNASLPTIVPAGGTPVGLDKPPADVATFALQVSAIDNQVFALQYPIGWPPTDVTWTWFAEYVVGAFLTAIAISMGSTFWFDALQNLIKIRGSGPKPGAR